MSRPVTRSMTRLMAESTKVSDQSLSASEVNVKPFPFLLLPGEIRNRIYRDLIEMAPSFVLGYGFDTVELFEAQPAITRVNKQIRAEALPMYYAETPFFLEVSLGNKHSASRDREFRSGLRTASERNYFSPFMGNVDFCRAMEVIESAQRQLPGYQDPLRYVRNLGVTLFLGRPRQGSFTLVEFQKGDKFAKLERHSIRVGGDEMDWADLESVGALSKAWMEGGHLRQSPPEHHQERLVNALWLLGVHIRSDSKTWVMFTARE